MSAVEPTHLYLVRHCRAAGQEAEAGLTPEGVEQAEALARFLLSFPIAQIVSSPYRRAVASAEPLARRAELTVHQDDRLAERVLSPVPLPNWQEFLAHTYDDFDLAAPGGESSRAAQARGVQALESALKSGPHHLAVFTHGNLMALLLHHFDSRHGFLTWQVLTNPDVYQIVLTSGHPPAIQRLWG